MARGLLWWYCLTLAVGATLPGMSGQPMKRRFDRALEAKAEDYDLTGHEELTPGEVYFFGRIAAGAKMGDLAEEFGVSRPWLYTWLKVKDRRQVREAAYQDAKRAAADYHAEEAGSVLERVGADPTSAEVSLAGKKSDHHRWLATVLDREAYGPKGQEVNVHLDLGQLHIQALEEVQAEWEEAEGEVLEAEVEPIQEEG